MSAPPPFDGDWYHALERKFIKQIVANRWRPDLYVQIKYGCAIYLSRCRWQKTPTLIRCHLHLKANEVMTMFLNGNTQDHLERYLRDEVSVQDFSAELATRPKNDAICQHFLNLGIKAIHYLEHSDEVVAVYDPRVIEIIDEIDGS